MTEIKQGHKTGIDLIDAERAKQITKHKYTVEHDVKTHPNGELAEAAGMLLFQFDKEYDELPEKAKKMLIYSQPRTFARAYWITLLEKPYKERVVIAASFLAAERDRLDYLEQQKDGDE
ncbi:MAG: hypothetical protein R2800_09970 [Flavipsychrobacter sp.]